MNSTDLNILQILTTITVDLISFNYNFDPSESKYFDQWAQNSNRDIKGVISLLLPFIDDKDNSYLLFEIITNSDGSFKLQSVLDRMKDVKEEHRNLLNQINISIINLLYNQTDFNFNLDKLRPNQIPKHDNLLIFRLDDLYDYIHFHINSILVFFLHLFLIY